MSVEKELQKVVHKLQTTAENSSKKLQDGLDDIMMLRTRLLSSGETVTEEDREALKECVAKLSSSVQSISHEHKDIHASISKYGRVIDKYFVQDLSSATSRQIFNRENSKLLHRAICEHLLREGRMDVAETLMNETGLSHHEEFVAMFTEIHQIVQALRNRDVDPALQWAVAHREQLEHHNSDLEFKLRRRKYLSLLSSGNVGEAVAYAKVFGQFPSRYVKDIQRLMGSLLFVKKDLMNSPYMDLFDPWHWSDVTDTFTRDACCLLGLSLESPLAISLGIGCLALPQLLHLQSVMVHQRQVVDVLAHRDELPCEIPLPWKHRYHSIFTCPILKQQASDSNPPVRLSCGHAISRDAMKKLVNHSGRLKCPYCPVEMSTKEVQELKF